MISAPVVPVLIGGVFAWRIYRRVRRNIGRQKLRPRRITISIVIFSVVSLTLLGVSFSHPPLLLGIGVALSLLFFGRMIYRFWILRAAAAAGGHPPVMHSPLTYFIFGLIAGYYLVYYIGLFVHTHDRK